MCVHALHTVHALPDLRVAAGRLRDVVSVLMKQSTLLVQAKGSSGWGVKDVVAPRWHDQHTSRLRSPPIASARLAPSKKSFLRCVNKGVSFAPARQLCANCAHFLDGLSLLRSLLSVFAILPVLNQRPGISLVDAPRVNRSDCSV
jgi:hypothetical protein